MKSDKQTNLFIKDGVAMAFEGPRKPMYSDYWLETDKASALPCVNVDVVDKTCWIKDSDGHSRAIAVIKTAGEVVPLEGWKLELIEEEYRKYTGDDENFYDISYRLVRSDPERNDESGETDQYYKEAHGAGDDLDFKLIKRIKKGEPVEYAAPVESQEELWDDAEEIAWGELSVSLLKNEGTGESQIKARCHHVVAVLKKHFTITRNEKKP